MNQGIDFDETPESFRFPGEESSTSSNLDNDDARQQALKAELQPGELIRWQASPNPKRLMLRALPLSFFGIFFFGFSVFWMTMVLRVAGNGPFPAPLFALFGIPFVLVGAGMLFSPFFFYRSALRTVYAITDRRAIVIEGNWTQQIQSYLPSQLGSFQRQQRSDGSGSIIFREEVSYGHKGQRRTKQYGFFEIPNVREVERMLQELGQQGKPT